MEDKDKDDPVCEVGTSFIDDPPTNGTKTKPVSAFLASECSTREDLAKICFTLSPITSAVVSSSSSNASYTGTDYSVSDHGGDVHTSSNLHFHFASMDVVPPNPIAKDAEVQAEREGHEFIKSLMASSPAIVPRATTSRVGRDNQRFETCSETGRLIRLVSGTVPITNDGSILLVSAAKKREWILPKGGWELDELLEESALRETFEEAGVLGTLGPRLSDVVYETRKGRKRRLEEMGLKSLEHEAKKISSTVAREMQVMETPTDELGMKATVGSGSTISSAASVASGNSSEDDENPLTLCRQVSSVTENQDTVKANIGDNEIKNENGGVTPATVPVPLASMCRMATFPLYISEVLEEWPESGRARRVFPIDEAIRISQRAEIRQVLEEIKRRGLHKPVICRDSSDADNLDSSALGI